MGAELELFWDATYAIVVSLLEHHPDLDPQFVGLDELAELVEALPGFQDDPAMATERILQDIFIAWYEEASQP
ncbi:MAG: Fe-S cluster assembly protein IscX [Anaerolineales bacterium]|nr:Fe-S cluster assembly protein IscX [Anaerolineales bacterium]MCB0015532.1 Fe-S cluster assembly protein IscX [Anaerolineales bacterium]MCB0019136.1 Fe-S cluster assembly protein IscX [Anaerolineales bacterium]MCB0029058.1 Fe-S cluster assembly protein IscX [Anaerolineales bacterium]MCB8959784.1 Fe-S cluster assembly protein IscX [Ardenticatenales bacterium]